MSKASSLDLKVPLLDLKAQYAPIREEVRAAMDRVCDSQHFIMGPEISALEEDVARYTGSRFGIGVSSGTDALLVALMALGDRARRRSRHDTVLLLRDSRGRGEARCEDRVRGHRSRDLQSRRGRRRGANRTANPGRHSRASLRTLRGDPGDPPGRGGRADRRGRRAGDRLQGLGRGARGFGRRDRAASRSSRARTSARSATAGWSSRATRRWLRRCKILRVHGGQPKYYHRVVGGNFRLDALQAAILRVKMKYLPGWTEARRRNADRYRSLFREARCEEWVRVPDDVPGHIYNQFVIRVPKRDELRQHLKESGIETEIYYPVPLHLQECFRDLGYKEGDFPHAEAAARESLALPIYPELSPEQQAQVVDRIHDFFA